MSMASSTVSRRAVRERRSTGNAQQKLVAFHWEGVSYTLDVHRNKVYRNWMAVETNKGFAILGAYRQSAAMSA
jgi:hypothetical protein